MRWRLRRDRGACTACGTELGPDAVWCGACGAPVVPPREVEEPTPSHLPEDPDDPEDGVSSGPSWLRPLVRLIAVALLVALAVAVLRPDPPPRPLLGQVAALAGMSATGPPPDGLRLAWEEDIAAADSVATARGRGVVAEGGRLRVGDLVVELASGRVVRRAAVPSGASQHRVEHTGDELVVVDTLTGEVVRRAPLSTPSGEALEPWFRSGDVTLLAGGGRSLLARDDGTVVAELDGTPSDHDRAADGAAALPVRGPGAGTVRLVAGATGEVVAAFDVAPDETAAVDVVDDLALVATAAGDLPGPTTGIPWSVEVVDARTGERLRSLIMQSAEPPRLAGFLDDGTIVFTTRSGREVAVRSIGPDGRFLPLAQVTTGVPVVDSALAEESAALATVGVAGGLAMAIDVRRGLLAVNRFGDVEWEVAVDVPASLGAGDGFVAVIPQVRGEPVRVVRAADGSVTARLAPSDVPGRVGTAPFAVLDGHVGLGPAMPFGDPRVRLGESTWLDLRTGRPTGVDDLFAPYAGSERDDEVTAAWTVHGTTTGPAGTVPIVSRTLPRSVVQLLDPGNGFTTFDLPTPAGDVVARAVGQPVGATATRLAVWRRGLEDPSDVVTHVLDRETGTAMAIDGVVGAALVDDLLLAVEVDEAFEPTALVGVDAGTGERLWSSDRSAAVQTTTPPRLDRDLLVTVGALDVEALSLHDGSRQWSHASDVELSPHLVLGPRRVVVVATDGEVVALDRVDGAVAWRTSLGVPVASIAGAGSDVLVGTADGAVVHLDDDGREVQRIPVGTGAVTSAAALGDTVVAVVDDVVVGLRPDGTGISREDQVELP